MHETHLMKDLMEDLLKHAADPEINKITKVYLRMGEFTEINPEILTFFFQEQGKGTKAEGAQLDIQPSETRELTLLSFDCE